MKKQTNSFLQNNKPLNWSKKSGFLLKWLEKMHIKRPYLIETLYFLTLKMYSVKGDE